MILLAIGRKEWLMEVFDSRIAIANCISQNKIKCYLEGTEAYKMDDPKQFILIFI